jgi:DNA primase
VRAGFEATVAPLGTALTEDQLALLWRMADEPILCFDGDPAGQRAAYRAVDIALPLVRPGKSLKFATLPQGQDPDDLVRSGGRDAMEEVLAGARPLAQMLWMRETEAGGFDTPERRAALEARIGEITTMITDDVVRKYYRQDFAARLQRLFAPAETTRRQTAGRFAQRESWRGRAKIPPGEMLGRDQSYVVMSPQLAVSPIHRGHRTAIPRREALILQSVLNHPWLLHDHLEELAEIEFRHGEAQKLKEAMVDIFAHGEAIDRQGLLEGLKARGFADLIGRVGQAITTPSVWGARPEAAGEDVLLTWKQLLALHRQWHSLIRELKDAEHALGRENSEAHYSWLRDVKARLSAIDGTEALIEGFGASSGRPARSL